MSGIEVVDAECNWIVQAMDDIQARAGLLLSQGMESQNQSDVANALQVFYNLKVLPEKVQSVIQMISEKVSATIHILLDFSALEGSSSLSSSSSSSRDPKKGVFCSSYSFIFPHIDH